MDMFASETRFSQPHAKAVAHLAPSVWRRANRMLVRKAIAEFSHERLLAPVKVGAGTGRRDTYVLRSPDEAHEYRFQAKRMMLDHWNIDPQSIEKRRNGRSLDLDALSFIIEFKDVLGIRDAMLPVYLDEISSILYGTAFKETMRPHRVRELAAAGFQAIETGMTEGHPSFVANSGRLGFDTLDYTVYAPEAADPLQIVWIAVLRERATYSGITSLPWDRLVAEELGPETQMLFETRLLKEGVEPSDYYFMPVHPWQWFNRISMSYAPEIAERRIVYLGLSRDKYQPQQSIRTFFNASEPSKRYVKMALSILNMGFMLARGLSPEDMRTTPEINEWLHNLLAGDPCLQSVGFSLICEVATLSYSNAYYEQALGADTPHNHVLAALWRESPVNLLRPGERLMTMAALLHVDPQGDAMVVELIRRSGLSAEEWIRRYLRAYLTPILHCFYAYDIIFMPHGENIILIMNGDTPARVIMKDLAEEMRILNGGESLPPVVRRNCATLADDVRMDGIFTDVFDCFFRHLAAILDERDELAEEDFWGLVGECVAVYQATQPNLVEKFARFDLFSSEFPRNCINRLQLRDNQQLLDPNDPDKGFEYAGTLENPLAKVGTGRYGRSALGRAVGAVGDFAWRFVPL
ncbi:MAG: IucA/IucC family protein [Rhodobacteraceae bacterium]|nr:IucA/IucC family protein [Paracoccaceae bacterium]